MKDNELLEIYDKTITKDKYYTISAVVEDAISDIEGSMDHYQKFLKWALRHWRELNFRGFGVIKTCRLEMDNLRQVILPEDYVRYQKIALVIGGKLKTIGVAYETSTVAGHDECGNLLQEEGVNSLPNGISFGNYGGYFFHNYSGSLGTGSLFSFGGGLPYKGYFKEDRSCRPMKLDFVSEVNKCDVVVEYVTDGLNPDGETIIDPLDYEYLRQCIHLERIEHDPRSRPADKYAQGAKCYYTKIQLVLDKSPLSPQDLLNLTRKYFRLTVKA